MAENDNFKGEFPGIYLTGCQWSAWYRLIDVAGLIGLQWSDVAVIAQ